MLLAFINIMIHFVTCLEDSVSVMLSGAEIIWRY